MSSVTRFLRQIPAGQQYYAGLTVNGTTITSATLATAAYVFVPTSANYVGNYPPGFVIPASQDPSSNGVLNALTTGLANTTIVLRDMGKTIYAPTGSTLVNAQLQTQFGFFREVQALVPQPISATSGIIGGPNGSVFGVYGGSTTNGYVTYGTFYLPTNVGGVYANPSGANQIQQAPQGQM
jgi:hypothetical protein